MVIIKRGSECVTQKRESMDREWKIEGKRKENAKHEMTKKWAGVEGESRKFGGGNATINTGTR